MRGPDGGRVALLLESDGPGGAEYMLLHLATELRRRGRGVVPVVPEDRSGWLGARLRERGFEPDTFRLRGPFDWRCVRQLARLFRERDVDVVHTHEFALAVFGAAAARMAGVPHVSTMHGGRYYAERYRRRAALRWSLRNSRAMVAVSRATRLDMTRALKIPPGRIRVVPNGIPPRTGGEGELGVREPGGEKPVVGAVSAVRRELGLDGGVPLVLSVGNLYPVKGHDVLLEALARVRHRSPERPWALAVAGRGGEEDRLRSRVQKHGLGDRVHLLGFRDDVGALLNAAEVYAMPSRSEGLPLALLEAMHAGKAIVASGVGGIPEAVTTGRQALLVPPGDPVGLAGALSRVLEDGGLRARLGAAARTRARERFSVEAMADAYEELYGWDGGRNSAVPAVAERADAVRTGSGEPSPAAAAGAGT